MLQPYLVASYMQPAEYFLPIILSMMGSSCINSRRSVVISLRTDTLPQHWVMGRWGKHCLAQLAWQQAFSKPGAPEKLGSTYKAFHWLTNTILILVKLLRFGVGFGILFWFGGLFLGFCFVVWFGGFLVFFLVYVLCCWSSWTGWFFLLPPTWLG